MDVYEALYPSRMMWRMRPDPIPLATQARILDAAIRAPNGGNTQRWHFLVVEDQGLKRKFGQLYRRASDLEQTSSYMADHFEEIPLLLFVFAIRRPRRCQYQSCRVERSAGRPR
jgi:nitroreductase